MIRLYTASCPTEYGEHDVGVALALYALRLNFGKICPELYGCGEILRYAASGKPYVGVGGSMYVSISHSHGFCAVAVSDSEVGVDIEYIDPNRQLERMRRIAERYFSPDELAWAVADLPERFYEVWCAKESYVKYTGEGLSKLRGFSSFGLPLVISRMRLSDKDGNSYAGAVTSREVSELSPIYVEAGQIMCQDS